MFDAGAGGGDTVEEASVGDTGTYPNSDTDSVAADAHTKAAERRRGDDRRRQERRGDFADDRRMANSAEAKGVNQKSTEQQGGSDVIVDDIPQSAGAMLQLARKQADLSVSEVAAATHISERQIASLERGDYVSMHSPPFVKGYLRIYGDFLSLDTDQLWGVYQAELIAVERGDAGCDDSALNAGHRWAVRKFSALLGGGGAEWPVVVAMVLPLLMVILITWALHVLDQGAPLELIDESQGEQLTPMAPLANIAVTSDAIDGEVGDGSLIAAADSDGLGSNRLGVADSGATQTVDSPLADPLEGVGGELLVSIGDSSAVTGTVTAADAPQEGVIQATEPSRETDLQSSTVAASSTAAAVSPVRASAAAMVAQHVRSDRLVIYVRQDSWIDIRDRSGARLYRNLARAGNKIDVSGSLPMSLHVGNAPGIELELNGASYAMPEHRSDKSARLTIAMQ